MRTAIVSDIHGNLTALEAVPPRRNDLRECGQRQSFLRRRSPRLISGVGRNQRHHSARGIRSGARGKRSSAFRFALRWMGVPDPSYGQLPAADHLIPIRQAWPAANRSWTELGAQTPVAAPNPCARASGAATRPAGPLLRSGAALGVKNMHSHPQHRCGHS